MQKVRTEPKEWKSTFSHFWLRSDSSDIFALKTNIKTTFSKNVNFGEIWIFQNSHPKISKINIFRFFRFFSSKFWFFKIKFFVKTIFLHDEKLFFVRIFFWDQVCISSNPRNHLEHQLNSPMGPSKPTYSRGFFLLQNLSLLAST